MTAKNNADKLILLVEDNEQIMDTNVWMFKRQGFNTAAALTLREARAAIAERKPDAIILDIMLPDGSGLDFMRELRESGGGNIPILLLTGLNEQEDIIRGLTEGGDDYLTKPFDFPILLARVEALLRRAERVPENIVKGRLTLNVTANAALLDGTDLLLTQKEFALLLIFAQNEGRYIDGEYLYEKVWQQQLNKDANALWRQISALKRKLGNNGIEIINERGAGYMLKVMYPK